MSTVRREIEVLAAPRLVWQTLLERPATWLGSWLDLDIRPGATGSLRESDGTRRRIEVEEVTEQHRVVWRWWTDHGMAGAGPATRVVITLHPLAVGTRLVVTETRVEGPGGGVRDQAPVVALAGA